MRVICRKAGSGSAAGRPSSDGWLTLNREYHVLGVYGRPSGMSYRILGDDGVTPALHPADRFQVTSPAIPNGWVLKTYRGSEWELTPALLAEDGFWELYFDGDSSAERTFRQVMTTVEA